MHSCMHLMIFLLMRFRLLNILLHTSFSTFLNIFVVHIPKSVIASSKDMYVLILVSPAKFAL